jgi:ATP-dependent protease Clp ATPase subunit
MFDAPSDKEIVKVTITDKVVRGEEEAVVTRSPKSPRIGA